MESSSRRFASSCPPRMPQPHPWLLISHGKHRQRQTFFSISQDRYHVRTIPELRSKTIWARCDQWLVLNDLNSSECSLFNLLSMENIQLPTIKPDYRSLCVLSSPPSHPDCRVVFFDRISRAESCLHFWKHGEKKFDEHKFSMGNDIWESALPFNGKIYASTLFESKLFMFDFSGPRPLKIPVTLEEQEPTRAIPYTTTWLVESMGELLRVKCLQYGTRYAKEVYGFIIKRYNFRENSWDEVKSIGKTRALFLGKNWGMSCSAATSKVEGNSIYFILEDTDRCLYVFDLEKQIISYSLPCPDVARGRMSYLGPGGLARLTTSFRSSHFYWITIPEYHENESVLIPLTNLEPSQQCRGKLKKSMEPSNKSWSELIPSDTRSLILSRHDSMESSDRSWSELLPDMLSLILSRLFAGDFVIFHMVCRSWRSITPIRAPPYPPVEYSPLAYTPCLVTLNNRVCEFYHPVYNATYEIDTPQLCGARIRSSGYGWLLMSKEESIYFFNPFTKEKIDVPYSPVCALDYLSTISFSAPPNSPDCLVIGTMFSTTLHDFAVFITIRRGEVEWTFHFDDNPFDNKFIRCVNCSPVFSNGKCYFLGELGNIVVFDPMDNSWDILGEAWSAREHAVIRPTSMVEDQDGALLAVFLTREHHHVQIRKFDLSKMIWENVERLGSDKMLYVSDGTSYLENSIARGMGNKIYFPKFYGDKVGVFYCLSTKMYRSFDGKYSNKSPFKLLEPRPCIWIKPVYKESVVEGQQLKW